MSEPDHVPERFDPPIAFHFAVLFGSTTSEQEAQFREVSGIGSEMELESVVEGGENRFVHQLPKAVKHPRLVLKRGIAANDSRLVTWCKKTLEGGLARRIQTQVVQVQLLGATSQPLRAWAFDNAYPVKWSFEPLEAKKNEVAIETIELVYTQVLKTK
ncbi:phage tail protein [Rhizobacter sp. P5_C2]